MTLADVAVGQPHTAAHNDERHAMNGLLADHVGVVDLVNYALPAFGGMSIFLAGDSISLNGHLQGHGFADLTHGAILMSDLSFCGWALPQTQGRFRFSGVAATHGWTSAQILSDHIPVAVASTATHVHLLSGTNDNNGVITLATTKANITASITAIIAAGKIPILATIPPQDANNTGAGLLFITKLNFWIRRMAGINKLPLADYWKELVSPTNTYLATYSSDGVHPTNVAAKVMGNVLAATLNLIPNGHKGSPLWAAYNPNLVLPDVTMISTTTGEKWTGAGSTTGLFFQGAVAPNAFKGSSFVITRGSAGDYSLIGPTSGTTAVNKWTAGNKVRLGFAVDVSRMGTNGQWSAMLYDSTDVSAVCGYQGMGLGMTNGSLTTLDLATTSGSKTITCASAPFLQSHVGLDVIGQNSALTAIIPAGTTIRNISLDGTQAYLSAAASATASAACLTIISPYQIIAFDLTWPAALIGHTIDFRFTASGTGGGANGQGTTISCAQVTVADLTALEAA